MSSFINHLSTIFKHAVIEKWSYPRLFDALKAAGVRYYITDVTHFEIKYFGDDATSIEKGPEGFTAEAGEFDQEKVVEAIRRTQRKETDYLTFLKEIAAAGITRYRVDMQERTVTYLGQDPKNKYVEEVPPWVGKPGTH
jgi:uncharacterized protein YbcV (DUF1398 family)